MSSEQTFQRCLRFYGRRTFHGTWKAVCIDLDLAVERPTREEAIQAIYEQVCGYVKAVLDTEDKDSLSYLLHRPAPWQDHMAFKVISVLCWPRILRRWLLSCIESFEKCFTLPEYTYAV